MAIFQTVMMAYMKSLEEKKNQSKEVVISGFLILANCKLQIAKTVIVIAI